MRDLMQVFRGWQCQSRSSNHSRRMTKRKAFEGLKAYQVGRILLLKMFTE